MKLYGFAGKILYIDLNNEKITKKAIDIEIVKKYIGGFGLNAWLLNSLLKQNFDPTSPENVLVYGMSPLVGTIAPGVSRVYLEGRSPSSGLLSQASAGHSVGVMIKYSGYDHLVITGKSKKPIYLRISDDAVEICNANHLWGLNTLKTCDSIKSEIGDKYWIDCIGPSGEKLVKYSTILCSNRSGFNKTGLGTIMGSKNLKAIAAFGTRSIEVANPMRYINLVKTLSRRIVSDPQLDLYRTYGMPRASKPGYSNEDFVKRTEKNYACVTCPVGCKHIIKLNEGRYVGLTYRASHLDALVNHNRLGDLENWDEIAKVVELENKKGIEATVASGMLNYLVLGYQNGIFSKQELGFTPKMGGIQLRNLIELIVNRKGIGKFLAEGFQKIDEIKTGSDKYASHMKCVGREHKLDSEISNRTIGSLVNPRGGDYDLEKIPFGDATTVNANESVIKKFYTDLLIDHSRASRLWMGPDGFNVGRLTKWAEDYSSVCVSLGFCNRPIIYRQMNLNNLKDFYTAATGLELTTTDLLTAGERIFNTLKLINIKFGVTRLDDTPSHGSTWPADKPIVISDRDYGSLNQILDDYYDERGWDPLTTIPRQEKLIDLNLSKENNFIEKFVP